MSSTASVQRDKGQACRIVCAQEDLIRPAWTTRSAAEEDTDHRAGWAADPESPSSYACAPWWQGRGGEVHPGGGAANCEGQGGHGQTCSGVGVGVGKGRWFLYLWYLDSSQAWQGRHGNSPVCAAELRQDSLSNRGAREMMLKIIFYAQAEMPLQFD